MIKSKKPLIKQGTVYGVKHPLKMIDDGARLSAEMNLKNTQNKRRKIVLNAKLNNFDPNTRLAIREFEAWQLKIFAKNAKKGWRFFNPDALDRPTPRSAREAWGGVYIHDGFEKNEERNSKIMIVVVAVVLLILSTL